MSVIRLGGFRVETDSETDDSYGNSASENDYDAGEDSDVEPDPPFPDLRARLAFEAAMERAELRNKAKCGYEADSSEESEDEATELEIRGCYAPGYLGNLVIF